MKKILIFLLLASAYFPSFAQTAPMSLTAVKSIISQKLTPIGTDRIDGQKMRDVTNTLAEQIDAIRGLRGDTVTRPDNGRPRLDIINFNPYITLPTSLSGNAIQIARSVQSFSELASCTHSNVLYDGSLWRRLAMTPTLSAVFSTTSAGYGYMFSASVNGYFYVRAVEGAVNVRWFGAKGDMGVPDGFTTWDALTTEQKAPFIANTAALQAAINFVCRAVSATVDGANPYYKQRPNALYFPSGTYRVGGSSLKIPGTIHMYGDGGQSFGGAKVQQLSPDTHLFEQKESDDYSSAAVQIEDLRLSNVGTFGNVALYFSRSFNASHNSLYLNRVWFQGFTHAGVWVYRTNDLQVTNCTFDGGNGYGIILGDNNSVADVVTEAKITGNSFYWVQSGSIDIRNARGTLIANNTFDANVPGVTKLPGITINSVYDARRITITSNTFTRISPVVSTARGNLLIAGNTIDDVSARVFEFTGLGYLKAISIQGNVITGTFSTPAGPGIPDAPFFSPSANLQGAIISNNTVYDSTATSTVGMYFPSAGNFGNDFSGNTFSGFATPYQGTLPGLNGVSNSNTQYIASGNFQAMNLKTGTYALNSAVTGMPYAASNWLAIIAHNEDAAWASGGPYSVATAIDLNNPQMVYTGGNLNGTWKPWTKLATSTDVTSATAALALGTAAKKNTGDFVAANGSGIITPYYSITGISTSAMSTTAFTTVMNAGTLPLQSMYDIKLVYVSSGIDAITQSWSNVPFDASDASSTGFTDFPTTRSSYLYQFGRYFVMRYVAGGGGYGLALKLSDSILATGGTIRLDFYRK